MKKAVSSFAILILLLYIPSCKPDVKGKSTTKAADSASVAEKPKDALTLFTDSADSLIRDTTLRNAGVGMLFLDLTLSQPRSLFSHNVDLSLVPASVIKLLTTSTALELFGSNKSFGTALQYNGEIIGRTLKGNLFIKGGGDPTFTPEKAFNRWTALIKELGIDTIDGYIIGDANIFQRFPIPYTWTWGELNTAYGTAASGLSIYSNVYEIRFNSDFRGPYAVSTGRLKPDTSKLQVYNLTTEADIPEENIFIIGDPLGNIRYIQGWIPKGKKEISTYAPIPNPPETAAAEFSRHLAMNRIFVTGRAVNLENLRDTSKLKTFEGNRTNIGFAFSPSVGNLVTVINQESNNFFAEHLIKHIGLAKYHNGSDESGATAIAEFWKTKGMDTGGLYIFDGCGISRYNAVTVRQLVFILQHMRRSPWYDVFYNSLPLAGTTGTLRNKFRETPMEGQLRAKTGTISRVRSLAGYLRTNTNKTIAFAIIINNFNCPVDDLNKKLEQIFIPLMKY